MISKCESEGILLVEDGRKTRNMVNAKSTSGIVTVTHCHNRFDFTHVNVAVRYRHLHTDLLAVVKNMIYTGTFVHTPKIGHLEILNDYILGQCIILAPGSLSNVHSNARLQ